MTKAQKFLTVLGVSAALILLLTLPGAREKTTADVLKLLVLTIGTLAASLTGFYLLTGDVNITAIASLLYMIDPYRRALCASGDPRRALIWLILPLYAGVLILVLRQDLKGLKRLTAMILGGMLLAAIGYADAVLLPVIAGFTVLAVILSRKVLPLLSVLVGLLIASPALLKLYGYLFTDRFEELGISLESIMHKGYQPGRFLGAFLYPDGLPGLGIGLLIGLGLLLWIAFVEGGMKKDDDSTHKFPGQVRLFLTLACFALILSLQIFPWDLVQRAALPFLRYVPMLRSPAVFFGLASFALCVPAAYAFDYMIRKVRK